MNKEYLNVITADDDEGNIIFFKNIFKDLKIGVKSRFFSSGDSLMDYLQTGEAIIPELIFIKYTISGKNSRECLEEIKMNPRFSNIVIAMYVDQIPENEIEEIFVNGANIFMKKPESYEGLKKSLTEIISINWQYHTSGLNKDTFIMKI
ncbi:response regulator [Chryseobacterium phocaeense]|uniref:response regulator n=1 Tax=Chryseobacterium phocaeense TaxID=1816690 RepID=UPI0009BADAC8|nr:response regulator [Chryseobacterium phocaeense]